MPKNINNAWNAKINEFHRSEYHWTCLDFPETKRTRKGSNTKTILTLSSTRVRKRSLRYSLTQTGIGRARGRIRGHAQADPHRTVRTRVRSQLLPQPRPPVAEPHLDPRLGQLRPLRQLLPRVNVRVLRPLERLLELVQLVRREGRARPPLLPLQRNPRLGLAVGPLDVRRFTWGVKESVIPVR